MASNISGILLRSKHQLESTKTFLAINKILEERNEQMSLKCKFFFDDIKCIHCHRWFGYFYDLINCYIFTNTLQFGVAKSPQNWANFKLLPRFFSFFFFCGLKVWQIT